MEKVKAFLKLIWGRLCLAAVVALLFGWCAQLVHTSFYTVSTKQITVDMDEFYETHAADTIVYRNRLGENNDGKLNAKLTGTLYLPQKVRKTQEARPCIILTHGYLNSKELQHAPAIEMSRRGYVVFAFDQYDHGDSTWDTPSAFNFYVWSVYDAVQYMYSRPEVLKDANGNGMIAVSGHSMGGFSSEIAVAWDEMQATMFGATHRKIAACLAVGADFRYDDGYVKAYSGGLYQRTFETYGTRTCGTIAGQYDEFFFAESDDTGANTVIEKHYASSETGMEMLGLDKAGTPGEFYTVDALGEAVTDEVAKAALIATKQYGERVIYEPKGDHPYNHWSPEATGYMIDFYDHAFTTQLANHNLNNLSSYGIKSLSSKNQSWWLKEVFSFFGILCIFYSLICGIKGLITLPVLRNVVTKEEDVTEVKNSSKARNAIALGLTLVSCAFCAYIIPTLLSRADLTGGLTAINQLIYYVILGSFLTLLVVLGISMVMKSKGGISEEARKALGRAALAAFVIGLLAVTIKWVVGENGMAAIAKSTNRLWSAPSINDVIYWAVSSGLIGLLFALINHFVISEDRDISHLGLKANIKQVGLALVIAIAASLLCWLLIVLVKGIFGVDFRVYLFALNDISAIQFRESFGYLPLYLVFYTCVGIIIANATAGKKGWKAYALAVLAIAIPSALCMLLDYGTLLASGKAFWPSFALNIIVVQGVFMTLVAAAIIQTALLKKTRNIWTGAFLCGILFTFIALASTCVYNFG